MQLITQSYNFLLKPKNESAVLISQCMYHFLRNLLFKFDPEWVHYFSMKFLKKICKFGFIKNTLSKKYRPHCERSFKLFNIRFPNRVGLAAGFDKNALYLNELEALGFGFVEIGTVTPKPQGGNEKPRLFRLPADKALINRMGFNNDGVDVVAMRLKKWHLKFEAQTPKLKNRALVIGGNIGKNKSTSNEDAWKDYEICFRALHDHVDYFVVNVSSPNTPGLRELQEKASLKKILTNLQQKNHEFLTAKPILLKIAPDLNINALDDVIELVMEIKLEGLVVANTSITRENLATSPTKLERIGAGGVSGMPLKKRATDLIQYIQQKTNGSIPLIGSGGIFTGEDASEKITAGASLVQVWTGFIYEGPAIAKNISDYLTKHHPG